MNIIRKLGTRIEEIILILIIVLNVMDFFEILTGELDYIKKIISWSALGYLLYSASLTKIFFGKRHRKTDLALITAYFVLIIKNFVAYTIATLEGAPTDLSLLYRVILQNSALLEEYSFYVGGTLLFVLAMYSAFRYDIFTPSLMHVIHEEGPHPKTVSKFTLRFSIILLVFVFFFVAVFNLMMEWLAIAVDAPLVMFGIFFYIFKAKDFGPETLIFKLGNLGESFYERFIELFHTKSKIFLGISGMLVLHLLTDIGNFVVPYITGLHDELYFSQFGVGHASIPLLLMTDMSVLSTLAQKFALVCVYTLNSMGIIMLLIAPAYLWYALFKDQPLSVPKFMLGLFAASLTAFLVAPVFKISSINAAGLVGVDILTMSALESSTPIITVAIMSLAVGLLVYLLSHQRMLKSLYLLLSTIITVLFFAMYIYFYFLDLAYYYIATIPLLFSLGKAFVAILLMLFFLITILFYVGGILVYFYELVKN